MSQSTRPERTATKPRHSRSHRLEFAAARSLERAFSALPERAADRLGKAIGRTLHLARVRRDVVESNLRLAFPERDEKWIARTTLASYEHLGREVAAMMRLSRLEEAEVIERTIPIGWEELDAARTLGRGVVLVTGHYGNWEMAAATIASRGIPIAAIVRRQGNRLVDERLQTMRHKLGVQTIYQGEAPSRVPRILRANGVVGIVGDQDARRSGVFVQYFGRPASTHRGPALFALRLGAPVFACIARRLPGDEVRYEVRGERVAFTPSGVLEADVQALTAELAARLEREVRVAPEQYFWFHKRWKTRPPEEKGQD